MKSPLEHLEGHPDASYSLGNTSKRSANLCESPKAPDAQVLIELITPTAPMECIGCDNVSVQAEFTTLK